VEVSDAPDHVIVAFGTAGDVLPLAALALRLVERGRRVWFLAPRPFEPKPPGIPGVTFHSILEDDEAGAGLANPALWHPRKGIEIVLGLTARSIARSMAILEPLAVATAAGVPMPCVTASSFAYGARVAQERWGWPLVTVDISSAWLFSADDPAVFPGMGWIRALPRRWRANVWWFIDRKLLDPLVAPRLNTWRANFGLAPARRVVGRWGRSQDLILGLYPSWFAPLPADAPPQMQLAGFVALPAAEDELPRALDAFLGTDRGTLLFMAGSGMQHSGAFFANGIDAAARLGFRALLLGPGAAAAASTARHAHGEDFAPLAPVLARCAGIVSHPGIGTIAHALAAGVPHVLTPYAFDQFENARRAVALGVAIVIPANSSARRIAASLARMLDDRAVAAACRQARQRMAGEPDAADVACDAIEALRTRTLSAAAARA
jgi:rhamnosyltransferase subunit B